LAKVGGTITGRILRETSRATKALYREAGRQGIEFDPLLLTQGFGRLLDDAGVVGPNAQKSLLKMANNFMKNKGGPVSPVRLQRFKQIADGIAKPIFEAERKGLAPPSVAEMQRARFFKMIGDNAREALRTIPGAEKAERASQGAIKARRLVPIAPAGAPTSLGQMATRTGLAGAGATIGGISAGLPGAGIGLLGGAAISNPQVLNTIGMMMDNPLTRQLLLQLGRGTGAAFAE